MNSKQSQPIAPHTQRAGNQSLEDNYSIYTADKKCIEINVAGVSGVQNLKQLVAGRLNKVCSFTNV